MDKQIIIICGPTASGKTAIALSLIDKLDIQIINADSMQIYADIPIITAQPNATERNIAEHLLYGELKHNEKCSAGIWVKRVIDLINNSFKLGKTPVLVGGTGLYIKSLIYGMSQIPDISKTTKNKVSQIQDYDLLKFLDENNVTTNANISPNDFQRQRRAVEVFVETGKPISYWQNLDNSANFNECQFNVICLWPDRENLRKRCDSRFDEMLKNGVVEEIEILNNKINQIDHRSPILKAHGVPEIRAYLNGEMTLQDASNKAKLITKQYAKRQFTWFRNQLPLARFLEFDYVENVSKQQFFNLLNI